MKLSESNIFLGSSDGAQGLSGAVGVGGVALPGMWILNRELSCCALFQVLLN